LRGGEERAKWKRDGTASGRDEGPALLRSMARRVWGGGRTGGRAGERGSQHWGLLIKVGLVGSVDEGSG